MSKYIVWHASFEGPVLEMIEANSLDEAFSKAFPGNEENKEEESIFGVRALRCGDDTVGEWEESKESVTDNLADMLSGLEPGTDWENDDPNFGFPALPEEVRVLLAKKQNADGTFNPMPI